MVRHDVSRCKYSHSEMGSRLYPIANRGVSRSKERKRSLPAVNEMAVGPP